MVEKVETLIVGAGVVGSSVAMHLAKKGMNRIRVIDFDLEGSLSSSELNAGGVRATWNQPINVQMGKVTIDYLAKPEVAEQVGYRPCGYLWLQSPEQHKMAIQNAQRLGGFGWPVEVWDTAQLQRKIPFIDKTEGVAGASFSPRDGLVNPNLLKNHFRSVARELGVAFDDRTWLQEVRYEEHSAHPIHALAERFEAVMSHETKLEIVSAGSRSLGRHKVEYQAERVINCAGPWASQVAKILGYQCPSYPLRRQVCIFDSRDLDLTPYGMIVDTSGVYFHPEATNGLAGFASRSETPGINYAYDGESFFTDVIWPALYERSTHFERLKHLTGWAGLYDVSPDESAIIGAVDYGGIHAKQKVYEAHSFSGHGVMHSYSAGLGLAEKIMEGRYRSFETLDILAGSRFESGKLVYENLII